MDTTAKIDRPTEKSNMKNYEHVTVKVKQRNLYNKFIIRNL